MAGHSQFKNIMHRKGRQDAQRSKLFSKLAREITVAAKLGTPDPAMNPRLRAAVIAARAENMPKDNIERAIKKASGELEGVNYEELRYEGYAPGGVAVLVDCMTDNKQRTVADVRHAFSKFGGNLGTDGSVAYLFAKQGVLSFAPGADEARITDLAIEAGADDVVVYPEDGSVDVLTSPDVFEAAVRFLREHGAAPDQAEVRMRAAIDVSVEGETAVAVAKLLEWLEELDDVQNVYSNADLPAEAWQ